MNKSWDIIKKILSDEGTTFKVISETHRDLSIEFNGHVNDFTDCGNLISHGIWINDYYDEQETIPVEELPTTIFI